MHERFRIDRRQRPRATASAQQEGHQPGQDRRQPHSFGSSPWSTRSARVVPGGDDPLAPCSIVIVGRYFGVLDE